MDKINQARQQLINEIAELQEHFFKFQDTTDNFKPSGMLKNEKAYALSQYYQQIINCVQEGIIVLDKDLKYQTWNPYMEQYSGLSADDVIGKSPEELFPFLVESGIVERLKRILKGESFDAVEIPFDLPQNGRSGWTSELHAPIKNITGEITGIICTVRDITEEKMGEKALKKEEENFRTFLELAPDAFFRVKQDGEIIFVNNSTILQTGYSREEIIGMNFQDLLSEKSKSEIPLRYDLLRVGCTVRMERELIRKDGSKFFVEMKSIQMPDGTFQSLVRDITEQKKLQEALNKSEKRYRTLFNLSPSGIMLEDLEGNIIDFNEAYRESTGYSREELLGKNIRMLVPPEILDAVATNLADLRNNQVLEHYVSTLRKDGERRLIELREKMVTLADGQMGIVVITNDVTKRKMAEQALRESEEKHRNLFEMMLDGVYKSTHSGKFVDVNPALVKMLGYDSKEELLSIDIKNQLYFDPSDRESIVLQEKMEEMAIFRMKKKDGTGIWVEDHGQYILDSEGNILFHEGIMRDVSERVKDQMRLQEYAEELKSSNQTKDKFFSIVSHDLRSPFQGLLAASKILSSEIDKLTKDEIEELAKELHLSIKRQYEFLTDLLDWSKLQRKNSILNLETIFLQKEVEKVIEPLNLVASQKGIEIRNEIDAGISVYADLNMLKLVLRNLISNGIKFTNTGGSIAISAKEKDGYIEISVTDNGIGIAKEKLEIIFNKDILYTTEGTANETGTGFGLMLCEEIVERHGSKIVVESEVGHGSKFSFELKRDAAD